MADAVIHIAGHDVVVGSRLRQRCAWCGALITDEDISRVAAEGTIAPTRENFPTWPTGSLVGMTGSADSGAFFEVAHNDGDQLPEGCCASLDPEVTR